MATENKTKGNTRTLLSVARFAALYAIYYYTVRFLDENFLQDAEEQLKAQKKKDEKKADGKEEDFKIPDATPEDGIFISLWFPRQRPLEMFDGSESEWKSMVAFARNKQERRRIEQTLTKFFVQRYVSNRKLLQQMGERTSGEMDWKLRSVDFDYTFPTHKPVEYERFGLEITDESMYFVTRPMSQFDYMRVKNTIWPEAIARSIWSGGSILFGSGYDKMKGLLDEKRGKVEDTIPQPETFSLSSVSNSDKEADPDLRAGAKPAGQRDSSTDSDKSAPQSCGSESWSKALIISSRPLLPKPTKDTAAVAKATTKTLAQRWGPKIALKPGMILIDGTVKIEGPRILTKLHWVALYRPQSKDWIPVSGEIKHYSLKTLKPLGFKGD
ncbi:uncharacterized protein KY384_008561 [Bacidia gigantensis]|uniref:uncharacterized protein n=1 Tax=Bacidia gigantensis TaxID=2732470 RepID=UPI001D04D8F9|nr:uncharacterized protein KY384_008561 [Bacidia gigantensis]KAG8527132.1 hypothetical protein KY384_008561 [Bacidia gigantensis]